MKMQCSLVLLFTLVLATAQNEYEPSEANPYGLKNPAAPEQLDDFNPFIGLCDCKSERRNQEGGWAEPVKMTRKYKYIMNGMAIQDETLKADGSHSGSIRQFNADSLKWYVHYYSSSTATPTLSSWEGLKMKKVKLYCSYIGKPVTVPMVFLDLPFMIFQRQVISG